MWATRPAGNLTREGSGTPSWNYLWDAENRLSSISGSAADTFTYDGDGERVKKSNGALFWRQHGGPYLTKTNLAGGIISERIFFNGLHVAILNPPTTVHYLFQDHLGGEHLVTDATGSSNCQDIDTLPFGSEIGYATSCNSSYRFAGMDRDYEDSAQLDYAINRYYDNRLGRFLSADEFTGGPVDVYSPNDPLPPGPLPYADISNPQSLNKYNYTYNNPLRYIDPNGHDIEFKNDNVEQMFNDIGNQSQSFRSEIDAATTDHSIIVTVEPVGTQQLSDHAPGDATAYQDSDGKVHMTIRVNPGDEGTAEHEVGHEKDARTNTQQFFKDALQDKKDKGGPNEKAHDDRPVEKRANKFKGTVEKERKQHRQEQKRQQVRKKKERY